MKPQAKGKAMSDLIKRALNGLCPQWRLDDWRNATRDLQRQLAESHESYKQMEGHWNAANDAFGVTLRQLALAREAIEKASHGIMCAITLGPPEHGRPATGPNPCDCWKSTALAQLKEQAM